MLPEIKVDATQALARFSPAGIPEQVRTNLRRLLPGIGKAFGAEIESKMGSELNSRTNINVVKQMVENPSAIFVRIGSKWTGDPSKAMVPTWLEEGTKPHEIRVRNAKVLAFFWPKLGDWFFGPKVSHPGTKAYAFYSRTLSEMDSEIRATLDQGVKEGL